MRRRLTICILLSMTLLCGAEGYPQITDLPTVYIETASGKAPHSKKHQQECRITIVAADGRYFLQQDGTVRLRGNSTAKMPKKPYRIKFDKKQCVLDAPAKAKKWTLLANYGDKSLMRNAVAFYIARQMQMEYVPYLTPVDLVLNGEYQGNYQLCDQIEVRAGRVDIDALTPADTSGVNLTGGYLIEADGYAVQEPKSGWFYSNHDTPVTFKSPDADEITSEQRLYLQHEYNYMEEHWRETLDMESFLKQFLLEELMANSDAWWSVYMYKKRNDPMIYTGPVWDFDLSMDNHAAFFPVNWMDGWLFEHGGSSAGHMRKLTHEIVHSPDIKQRMSVMWAQMRREGLCTDSIIAYIDAYAERIDPSQQLNFERWEILDKVVFHNPRCYYSYDGEVDALRIFVRERMRWMDDKLGYTAPAGDASYRQEGQLYDPWHACQVVDMTGHLLISRPEALPTGVYLIRDGQYTRKIIK